MSKTSAPRPANARGSSEGFTKRRSAKRKRKVGQNKFDAMVRCAAERIIGAFRFRGSRGKWLYALNFKEAVHKLLEWVDNRDQRLGWGEQVIKVLSTALHNLMQTRKVQRVERGFLLTV